MPMMEGLYWQSDVRQERFYEENRMYCGSSLIIRLLLAGITGYFIWHSGQDKYVRAEMAGASEGVGIAGAEERSRRKQAEQAASQIRTAFKAQTARMQRMAVYPPIQTMLKHRGPEQEHRMRTLR